MSNRKYIFVIIVILCSFLMAGCNRYIVTYNTNGGTVMTSLKIEKNGKILKPTDPVKRGYKFLGWYSNGELYDFDATVTKNITIEAIWEKIIEKIPIETDKYIVTFNTNGGSSVSNQIIESGKRSIKPADPTRNGYTFAGWDFDFNTEITSDVTVNAKWNVVTNNDNNNNTGGSDPSPTVTKYTVTFNGNGGTTPSSQTVNKNSKATKPANPTRSGYTFVAWQLSGSNYNFNTPVTANITLVALWQVNAPTYSITLTDLGGMIPQSVIRLKANGSQISFVNVKAVDNGAVIAEYNSSQGGAVGVKAVIDSYSTYIITLNGGSTITLSR